MHGQLVVVLGVENQQVNLSLRNEFSVFIDLPPHGDDLFDPDRQALSVDGLLTAQSIQNNTDLYLLPNIACGSLDGCP